MKIHNHTKFGTSRISHYLCYYRFLHSLRSVEMTETHTYDKTTNDRKYESTIGKRQSS